MTKQTKSKTKHRFILQVSWKVWVLLMLLCLLVAATYTWFSLSKTPFVSDMEMYVGSTSGLELALSPDAEDEAWGQSLDLSTLLGETNSLRPITYMDGVSSFYAASYGIDGRIAGISTLLNDEENSQSGSDPYYIRLCFYARSAEAVSVSLSPAVELADGVSGSGTYLYGTPIWDSASLSHTSGASGAECCIRIGLKITPISAESYESVGETSFFIYEPNADSHLSGSTEVSETLSITGNALVDAARLIQQTSSSWTEASPVQRDVISPSLGEFLNEVSLFDLDADTYAQIELYIWLEGQDIDCTNEIGQDNYLTMAIQFTTGEESDHGGLEIVE